MGYLGLWCLLFWCLHLPYTDVCHFKAQSLAPHAFSTPVVKIFIGQLLFYSQTCRSLLLKEAYAVLPFRKALHSSVLVKCLFSHEASILFGSTASSSLKRRQPDIRRCVKELAKRVSCLYKGIVPGDLWISPLLGTAAVGLPRHPRNMKALQKWAGVAKGNALKERYLGDSPACRNLEGGGRLFRVPLWLCWEERNEIKQEKMRLNIRKCFLSQRCIRLGNCLCGHGLRTGLLKTDFVGLRAQREMFCGGVSVSELCQMETISVLLTFVHIHATGCSVGPQGPLPAWTGEGASASCGIRPVACLHLSSSHGLTPG